MLKIGDYMKKLLFLLCLFLFPIIVNAKEKVYTLELSSLQTNEIIGSNLSIRDYLIYQNISSMELFDGLRIPVNEENRYCILDNKYLLVLLDDYDVIEIKYSNTNKDINNTLDFSNINVFLDSSIYNYYLFGDSISKQDSSIRFIREENDDIYGRLISKNTEKELVTIKIKNKKIYFSYSDDLSIVDNTSFVKKTSDSDKIEYVSVVFSHKENNQKKNSNSIFSHSLLLFIVLIFTSLLVISVFYGNKKK